MSSNDNGEQKADRLRSFNGPGILIAMLRELDPQTRKKFQEKLEKVSPIFAKLADHCEFIYSDIFRLEDKSLQRLMTKVEDSDWLLAWKLSSDPVRNKLLKNMSERKKEDFLSQAAKAAKVHRRQVIKVQKNIASLCLEGIKIGEYRLHSRRHLSVSHPK